jgi:membrane protease YdiL (CAAX protease family)
MSIAEAEPDELLLRVIQSLFVVLGAVVGASFVVAPAATLAEALGVPAESPAFSVVRTVANFVGFGLACAVFLAATDSADSVGARLPSGREALLIAGGVTTLLAAQFALLLGLAEIGIETGQNRAITADGRAPIYFLYMVPVSILVVGPAEELLFRGVVQGRVSQIAGPATGIGFASVLFGVIHYASVTGGLGGRVAYVAIAGLLGVLLGLLYERTGNVVVPALTHGLYNAVLFGIQYADVAA